MIGVVGVIGFGQSRSRQAATTTCLPTFAGCPLHASSVASMDSRVPPRSISMSRFKQAVWKGKAAPLGPEGFGSDSGESKAPPLSAGPSSKHRLLSLPGRVSMRPFANSACSRTLVPCWVAVLPSRSRSRAPPQIDRLKVVRVWTNTPPRPIHTESIDAAWPLGSGSI